MPGRPELRRQPGCLQRLLALNQATRVTFLRRTMPDSWRMFAGGASEQKPNIERARELFAAWASGDFGGTLEAMDPHMVLVVREGFIESGVHVGAEAIGDYTRGFIKQYDSMVIEATDLRASGDTVLAHVVQRGSGRTSAIEIETPYYMLLSYRGSKIIRMESILEEADALEAAGLSG